MVNDYLTSNFAWFLLTNTQGLTYLQRIPFEMDMFVDFYTDNLLVKAYERFSFSYSIFGLYTVRFQRVNWKFGIENTCEHHRKCLYKRKRLQ